MVTLSLLWYLPAQLVPALLSVSAIRETDRMMSHLRSPRRFFDPYPEPEKTSNPQKIQNKVRKGEVQ